VQLPRAIQRAYDRAETSLAFLLILVALSPQFVPIDKSVSAAALSALGFIILSTLFRMEKSVERPSGEVKTYNEFYEVASEMRVDAMSEVGERDVIRIQALGMSLNHAWPFFSGLIDTILAIHASQKIHVEVAMLSPTWEALPAISSSKERLEANMCDVYAFYSRHQGAVSSGRLRMSLYPYAHMPNWHGVCISDHTLFLSSAIWSEGMLVGSGNPYHRYRRGVDLGAERAFSAFSTWFDFIRTYGDALDISDQPDESVAN
jgi:hypothetical protein